MHDLKDDFAEEEIIVMCVVVIGAMAEPHLNIYACLLNWLLWKHTTCDMIRLLLNLTIMYDVSKCKLFEKIHLFISK